MHEEATQTDQLNKNVPKLLVAQQVSQMASKGNANFATEEEVIEKCTFQRIWAQHRLYSESTGLHDVHQTPG